ncbi:MAG TPA: MFS transporter [Anaerolineae bacterium]|nr:MFS transporter [Anaerolineae bacterium]
MAVATANEVRFAALRHRNFTLLWAGLLVSNVGTWMQNVAQGWLVLQLTNSPLWLGLLGLSFAIPMIVFPLFGGVVADRVNRIRLLYITQTGQMLTAIVLAALTWLNVVTVWHILIASFLSATFLAFDNPTRQALIPDMVPRRDLLNALSLNAATYNGAALLGPAIAGALLAPLGAGTLFFLNGISYGAVIIALLFMRNVRTHAARGQPVKVREAMLSGLRYAWRSRLIRSLLALSALAAIFGQSYRNLLPIFARDIWSGGEEGYGLLLSAAGAGALVGAFGLASIKNVKRQGAVLISSGLIFAATIIAFALSQSLALGIVLLFFAGVSSTVFGTIIATFIQMATPNELRGRVMSLYAITLIGLPALGSLAIGSLAEALGGVYGAPRAVLLGALVLGVVLIGVSPFFWRRSMSTHIPTMAASPQPARLEPEE